MDFMFVSQLVFTVKFATELTIQLAIGLTLKSVLVFKT